MSLFLPDLERELRRAIRADAHLCGNKATTPRRKLAPIVALAASMLITLLVVVIVIRASGSQTRQSATPSTATHRPESPFAALRRTRTRADAMPATTVRLLRGALAEQHADAGASRRVFASPAQTVWLLPASVHGSERPASSENRGPRLAWAANRRQVRLGSSC